jgi:hypothetical protein
LAARPAALLPAIHRRKLKRLSRATWEGWARRWRWWTSPGGGSYAQFLLVAELGVMVRDVRKIVSLLWYKDMGEIKLIRQAEDRLLAKPDWWRLRQPA